MHVAMPPSKTGTRMCAPPCTRPGKIVTHAACKSKTSCMQRMLGSRALTHLAAAASGACLGFGLGVDVADVGRNTGRALDIVQRQLADVGVHLGLWDAHEV